MIKLLESVNITVGEARTEINYDAQSFDEICAIEDIYNFFTNKTFDGNGFDLYFFNETSSKQDYLNSILAKTRFFLNSLFIDEVGKTATLQITYVIGGIND